MGCYPKNLNSAPQYIAGLAFYPMGLFFGYYLNLFYLNNGTNQLLINVEIWPICAGIVAAGLTAFIQVAIKITFRRYIFEHFYLLMAGLGCIFIGGIIISSNESDISSSLYICFVGHGICYIATLSYINIRTAKSERRFFKLSMPGIAYLFGVALGSQSTIRKVIYESDPQNEYEEVNISIGSIITTTSSFLLVCYFVNEMLHWTNSQNYKASLDEDVNRENNARTILENKYFHITRDVDEMQMSPALQYSECCAPTLCYGMRLCFFTFSNVIAIAVFYFPFIYFNQYTQKRHGNYHFYNIFWFGVLGSTLSLVVQYFFTNRIVYLITVLVKIIGVGFFVLFLGILEENSHEIILFMLFCTLGFHYQANDVNLLCYGSLKYNELEIFLSYMFQYIVIGVFQYCTILRPDDVFNFDRDIILPYQHGLIFIGLFGIILFVGVYVLPKKNERSLLEIQNIINNRVQQSPVVLRYIPSNISGGRLAVVPTSYSQEHCCRSPHHHYANQVHPQPYTFNRGVVLKPHFVL